MKKVVSLDKARLIFISLIVALIAVVGALTASLIAINRKTAVAAGGSLTVHVYDPSNKYNELGGWIWVKGSGVDAHDVPIGKVLEDEQYFLGDNKARPFELKLDEREVDSLKAGGKLGILINFVKNPAGTSFDEKFTKETQDVYVSLTDAFDANNHADVYYVRKDTEAYTDLNKAKEALKKIVSARFTAVNGKNLTVAFTTTTTLNTSMEIKLFNGKDELCKGTGLSLTSDKMGGTIKFALPSDATFDYTADYQMTVADIKNPAPVTKSALIDQKAFIDKFECKDTQELEYGAIYTKEKTTFRVWAPFASSVALRLYSSGDVSIYEEVVDKPLAKRNPDSWGGVWELDVEGDLVGKFYTYAITNYGETVETVDMYAKAAGVNGERGMVVDLSKTNPTGWDKDKHLYTLNKTNANMPIVYELQVKDFSSSPTSGMKNKGKYLAFTEKGTTVPGDPSLKTGIDYLKDLGITYVHLNPIYDYSSVDEISLNKTSSREIFNWGYDPQNYNVPDGSLSSNPYDGNVRINELKQMIMALHEAGIGVIMDVVYNHTYATAGQAFHDTVPFYYHRTNADGSFANGTGCGNETASERTMMRKFMVDSVTYWADEYHIDGFRFDLMGIHDRTTMKLIRSELDNLKDNGSKVLMYGEPWAGYEYKEPKSIKDRFAATSSASLSKLTSNSGNKQCVFVYYDDQFSTYGSRIATFNDSGREGLRGGNDLPNNLGWFDQNGGNNIAMIKRMLQGGVVGEQFDQGAGKSRGDATQNVAYSCAHDNYTLWDQLVNKNAATTKLTAYDDPNTEMIKMNETVSSAVLMSSGISFLLAGEEFGRTKYGNHDSYNSTAKLNGIDWTRQKSFKSLVDHYKKVIKVRKAFPEYFGYFDKGLDKNACYNYFTDLANGSALMGARPSASYDTNGGDIVYYFNPTESAIDINTSGYKVYVANGSTTVSGGVTKVEPHSVVIMGKKTV